jgi:hypothetical protein
MGTFATGKKAYAISDRSGNAISLQRNGTRMEWIFSSLF